MRRDSAFTGFIVVPHFHPGRLIVRTMTRLVLLPSSAIALVLAALLAGAPSSLAASRLGLQMYTLEGDAETIRAVTQGLELTGRRYTARGVTVDAVLSDAQRDAVAAAGVQIDLKRNARGETVQQQAVSQELAGYQVFRSWDEAGGIRDELYALAADNPQLVKLSVLGHTAQGREIIALKLTAGAATMPDGKRPAVLFSSLQHAREWISVEVNRRLLHYFVDNWRANQKEAKGLLQTTELWFVIVANPDGYQFTFDSERLWRKNVSDNDGDGQITLADGVDLNRNFGERWGYDDEGSSPDPSEETYRGPSPASEPETQALQGLIGRIKPRFQSNMHSTGELLLYGQGWQVGTLDADNPIYVAVAGTDANPAIPGFNPGQSADALYVTNGETTDFADKNAGTVALTVELGEGEPGAGFVFPDNEALIQAEFQKTLAFHLGLVRSAMQPATPVSPVGIVPQPFYLDQDDIDPQNGHHSLFDFKFAVSYGDPQEVRVLARRSLGAVTVRYRINNGIVRTASTSEWAGGARYGPGNGAYYHVMRGQVTGTKTGDTVTVSFAGGGRTSGSFTYTVESNTDKRVLILAAEDYTGASPASTGATAPSYLSFYADALTANGVAFDVYDVDAHGRSAPDNLGVLSHYDAVIWYTGNDIITREAGWGAGNASRLAMQELLEVRDYINEGGRVLYAGQRAGQQYTPDLADQLYDPFENLMCRSNDGVLPRCLALSGSGNGQSDPIEYFFGATITRVDGGLDPQTGVPFNVAGIDEPLTGAGPWSFNGADSAGNQNSNSSFFATADLLGITDPAGSFPQFASWPAAEYLTGISGAFEPHTGDWLVWSNLANAAYKRLSRTITVPAGGATLEFWTSYNLEFSFDYLVIEAHTVGQDNWTTLPDTNGHTSGDLSDDGACPGGWSALHPFLAHYQTLDSQTGRCSPTGSTGAWNAATGNSQGWQQWRIDLSSYAGTQVEVSITVLSDLSVQEFPGVFVDDISVSTGEGTTSFEGGLDGWTVPGAPPGDGANLNDWVRRGGLGIKEAAAVATEDTVYMGFGLEGVTGADTRNELMRVVIDYLLR
ncbi:MAG TPA: M14 family zinc carboxypeptidase [Candidatus Polarisedimenticolia bacterium]|nr:M14 family zinc carboxypeptidase [Candidatus Polarisedimenticolia bacterium]